MGDEVHPVDSREAAESVPQRSGPRLLLKNVFVGPRGLRAGWKVLIFFLIIFAISFCLRPLGKLNGKIDPKFPVPPGPMVFLEFLRAVTVLGATAVMARFIDRKPWGYFGIPLRNAFRSSFWIGVATGVGVLALQLEIMHLCGWFDYGTVQLNGGAILVYGLLWALMFLCGRGRVAARTRSASRQTVSVCYLGPGVFGPLRLFSHFSSPQHISPSP
jgi:hypothetical protein